ncbi:MAG: calcium-binding protein [Cyanobacteria bacterium P01_H01_bin.21]
MTEQLSNPIVLSDGEIEVIFEDIQAPVGEPAIDIPGSETLLAVIPGGSITAPDLGNTAVQASGENVTVLNLGEISGDLNGISTTGDDLRLLNIGTIQSNSRAVDLSDGDGSFILNTGNIVGTGNQRNGTLYVDGTVDDLDLINSGTIDAGEGNLGDAVSVQVGATDDPGNENINITNNGLLQGRGDGPDVFANGGRVTANGSSGLRFFNGSGQPEATVSGSVVNRGTITSEVNVGFLGGLVVEDGVAFDGRIVNSGLISGPRNGLYIGDADHNLSIVNTGQIESGSRVVNLDGDNVTLTNQGTILGTGPQRDGTVYLDGTADNITVNNQHGTIDAGVAGSGISVQVGAANGLGNGIDDLELSADISNSGLIQGRGDSNVPAGIRLFVGAGLTEATFTGDITNELDGVIASEESAGLLIEAGVIFDGQITNFGTISGGNGFAIDAEGALGSVDILNAGTLHGSVRLGAGSDRFIQTSGEDVVVTGGLGNDTIIGGDGNDILNGGDDNDILTGGGGSDTFEFGSNAGIDVVTDFSTSNDLLDVGTIFDNVSDVLGAATQIGTSTLIDFGDDNAVLLLNVNASDLTGNNFVFAQG